MSKRFLRNAPTMLVALAVAAASSSGCGATQQADPDQVGETLRLALDGWQAGMTPEAMASQAPPIHVADPKWKTGFQLVRYEVGEAAKPSGFDLQCPVVLWMKDPKGKPVREKTAYTVSASPARTVVRAAF